MARVDVGGGSPLPTVGRHHRLLGVGTVASGVACPCHVLVGLVGLATGGAVLSPAAQDGLHAVYVPLAILVGALLLRPRAGRANAG